MNPRGTFERVYDAIRQLVEAGQFAPGDHLEPALLADRLYSSITPVRDALQRLVGERLVEASPGDGFRLPLLTEVGLRHLYDWNGQLILLALKAPAGAAGGEEQPGISPGEDVAAGLVARTGQLFTAIARRGGNLEQLAAIRSLNSRLSMVRYREIAVIEDFPEELEQLEGLGSEAEAAGLRRALGAYHRRRQRLVDRIVMALQQR